MASLQNITIDDEYGDPSNGLKPYYAPSDGWNAGASCSACLARPDPSHAYNGSWHDAYTTDSAKSHTVFLTFHGKASWLHDL